MGGPESETTLLPSLQGLRELETEGKTKTEPERGGPDRQTRGRKQTCRENPMLLASSVFPDVTLDLSPPSYPSLAPPHPSPLQSFLYPGTTAECSEVSDRPGSTQERGRGLAVVAEGSR